MTYTVKEIADKMGMTAHTIRFYTDMGLLPCSRDQNNRRLFDDESVNWLKGIQCLRKCGVSIENIKVYSDLCLSDSPEALQKRYQFMQEQRELAHRRLREAQELAAYLDAKVQHYESILAGKLSDDTNPATQKITMCETISESK